MKSDTVRAINSAIKFGYSSSSEILRAGAQVLRENFWAQGMTATQYFHDKDRRRYDVIGALIAATGFPIQEAQAANGSTKVHQTDRKSNNFHVWQNTVGRKGRQGFLQCMTWLAEITGDLDIERWNDKVAQDKDEVVQAMMDAAELAESWGD